MILRFSEGCLTNTNSPFAFSHYAKKSKSGNKGRRYFSSQPLLALFSSPILGKVAYSEDCGLDIQISGTWFSLGLHHGHK